MKYSTFVTKKKELNVLGIKRARQRGRNYIHYHQVMIISLKALFCMYHLFCQTFTEISNEAIYGALKSQRNTVTHPNTDRTPTLLNFTDQMMIGLP
jgi:hypothetical protein